MFSNQIVISEVDSVDIDCPEYNPGCGDSQSNIETNRIGRKRLMVALADLDYILVRATHNSAIVDVVG